MLFFRSCVLGLFVYVSFSSIEAWSSGPSSQRARNQDFYQQLFGYEEFESASAWADSLKALVRDADSKNSSDEFNSRYSLASLPLFFDENLDREQKQAIANVFSLYRNFRSGNAGSNWFRTLLIEGVEGSDGKFKSSPIDLAVSVLEGSVLFKTDIPGLDVFLDSEPSQHAGESGFEYFYKTHPNPEKIEARLFLEAFSSLQGEAGLSKAVRLIGQIKKDSLFASKMDFGMRAFEASQNPDSRGQALEFLASVSAEKSELDYGVHRHYWLRSRLLDQLAKIDQEGSDQERALAYTVFKNFQSDIEVYERAAQRLFYDFRLQDPELAEFEQVEKELTILLGGKEGRRYVNSLTYPHLDALVSVWEKNSKSFQNLDPELYGRLEQYVEVVWSYENNEPTPEPGNTIVWAGDRDLVRHGIKNLAYKDDSCEIRGMCTGIELVGHSLMRMSYGGDGQPENDKELTAKILRSIQTGEPTHISRYSSYDELVSTHCSGENWNLCLNESGDSIDYSDPILSAVHQVQSSNSTWNLLPKSREVSFDERNRLSISELGGVVGSWSGWIRKGVPLMTIVDGPYWEEPVISFAGQAPIEKEKEPDYTHLLTIVGFQENENGRPFIFYATDSNNPGTIVQISYELVGTTYKLKFHSGSGGFPATITRLFTPEPDQAYINRVTDKPIVRRASRPAEVILEEADPFCSDNNSNANINAVFSHSK